MLDVILECGQTTTGGVVSPAVNDVTDGHSCFGVCPSACAPENVSSVVLLQMRLREERSS